MTATTTRLSWTPLDRAAIALGVALVRWGQRRVLRATLAHETIALRRATDAAICRSRALPMDYRLR